MVVGARQSFQFFRQNTWFLENNGALSKFLYGVLHYLINFKQVIFGNLVLDLLFLILRLHAFFSNPFISNAVLILAKNQANAKHHLEAEFCYLKNYSYSLIKLSSKNNGTYSKK